MTDQSVAMAGKPPTIAGSLRGFASYMRNPDAFDDGDREMVAKKFEAGAEEIERLRKALDFYARHEHWMAQTDHADDLSRVLTAMQGDDEQHGWRVAEDALTETNI